MDEVDRIPPEVTPPLGIDLRLAAMTAVNALLILYLLWNAVAPIVWGEFFGGIERRVRQIDELTEPVLAPATNAAWKETYWKHRTAFVVVLGVSVLPVIGLMRSVYANYIGEFPPLLTTGSLILAAILILVNLFHGWGGWWGVAFLLLALGELAALYMAPLVIPKIGALAPELRGKALDWCRSKWRRFRGGPQLPTDGDLL